ncbi:MAG: methyltransferase domain-containing protein [Candidatus Stahlbacteria bacterium]|nr:methyltransferase domain-containing protein [Candidatus Stahlbacteria bacterium]
MKILLIILAASVLLKILIRILAKLHPSPAPAFIGRFLDSNLRRKVQSPNKLIHRSGIREGIQVLELGCGSGAFTTFVARTVGENGKVYALDIQPKMLKQLEQKLSKTENKDIKNVELIHGDAYKLPFDNNSLDLAYMVTVLQEIPDRHKALQEIKRVLKPGGMLAVTEHLFDPDYALKSTTIKLCQEVGFVLDEALGSIWNYTVRVKKP